MLALPEQFEVWQETLGWQPNQRQQWQFQQLYERVMDANRSLNLTRITDPQEFWEKHLWDSLSGIQPWLARKALGQETDAAVPDSPLRVIDIGTGAGFPGVPIAIACPHWSVTLLDSTGKKMAFVDSLLTELQLSQAKTRVDRAEAVGHDSQHRANYDLAVIRAVATASVCAEYAIPLLRVGGTAILYRGQWTAAEAESLETALQPLGAQMERLAALTTPLSQSIRHCIYLKKVKETKPIFPRPVGVPTKSPL